MGRTEKEPPLNRNASVPEDPEQTVARLLQVGGKNQEERDGQVRDQWKGLVFSLSSLYVNSTPTPTSDPSSHKEEKTFSSHLSFQALNQGSVASLWHLSESKRWMNERTPGIRLPLTHRAKSLTDKWGRQMGLLSPQKIQSVTVCGWMDDKSQSDVYKSCVPNFQRVRTRAPRAEL